MDFNLDIALSRAHVSAYEQKILPLRQQSDIRNAWLQKRLEHILPEIMQREQMDMWIVCAREYNEDPVLMSLLPAPMLSARRRTILVFSLREGNFEALNVAPPGVGLDRYYRGVWEKGREDLGKEDQWQCLQRIVRERDPQRIGINSSDIYAFGDGLTQREHHHLMAALGDYAARCSSAERVCVGWLERRLPEEISAAVGINQIAHSIIAEAFSSRVIHPGVSRASDVAWWIRQRIHDLTLSAWFQPTVSIQRQGEKLGDIGSSPEAIIQPGDLLHCDVGLHYLGLATDTQQLAYVLKLGESSAPQGLQDALQQGNRLQDIVIAEMHSGRSGNEILAASLEAAERAGIRGRVYSHPIGYHGHGAGPTIGMYDNQGPTPGRGDYPLYPDTLHSIELFAEYAVPEWQGQTVKAALEQIVAFTNKGTHFLGGRQTALHLLQ